MSPYQDQDPYYNLERDILAPARTPPLQEVKPIYESVESPLPLVRLDPSSSDSTDVEGTDAPQPPRKPRKRKRRTQPTFADGVLIRAIDPSQVELASFAERVPLESASESEEEEDDYETESGSYQMKGVVKEVRNEAAKSPTRTKDIAEAALTAIPDKEDDWPMIHTQKNHVSDETVARSIHGTAKHPPNGCSSVQTRQSPRSTLPESSHRQLNTLPPPRTRPLTVERLRLDLESAYEDDDSITKSPALGRFAITPRDVDPDIILPAMQQKSPSQSSPAASPDQRVSLPSLRTTIGHFESASAMLAGMSPGLGRPSPSQLPSIFQSPVSYQTAHPGISPPGPPSQFHFRTMTRESNTSTSSEYTSSTSATASTPVSIITQSPAASNPSSLTTVVEIDTETEPERSATQTVTDPGRNLGLMQVPELDSESESEPELDEGDQESQQHPLRARVPSVGTSTSNRLAPGSYACTFEGCTAAPFQTQYLLNSHMNVHSNTRSHFCPVKGCPRGPGGQGFKRKNEMIR